MKLHELRKSLRGDVPDITEAPTKLVGKVKVPKVFPSSKLRPWETADIFEMAKRANVQLKAIETTLVCYRCLREASAFARSSMFGITFLPGGELSPICLEHAYEVITASIPSTGWAPLGAGWQPRDGSKYVFDHTSGVCVAELSSGGWGYYDGPSLLRERIGECATREEAASEALALPRAKAFLADLKRSDEREYERIMVDGEEMPF